MVVWDGLGLAWQVNRQRNNNVFKFHLQLLILSQKHILGVKKEVWDDLEVVWRCFGGVSMDPDRSYHFTKKIFP